MGPNPFHRRSPDRSSARPATANRHRRARRHRQQAALPPPERPRRPDRPERRGPPTRPARRTPPSSRRRSTVSTVLPYRCTTAAQRPARSAMISRNRSAPTTAAMSIERTTSANSTVTCLYSARVGQSQPPHRTHYRTSSSPPAQYRTTGTPRLPPSCHAASRLSFHVTIVSPPAGQHVPYRRCDHMGRGRAQCRPSQGESIRSRNQQGALRLREHLPNIPLKIKKRGRQHWHCIRTI